MKTTLTPLRLFRVTARLMSILLFLLWGSLFIDHLMWFFPPMPLPPFHVWFGQAVHLCLLLSYILGFWKEKLASGGMVLFSLIFFLFMIGSAGGVMFFLLSSLPAGLYALCWLIKRKQSVKDSRSNGL